MSNELTIGPWSLVEKIGSGAFGEIYECCNTVTDEVAAVKIERASKKRHALKIEVNVLKALQFSPYVCRYIDYGCSANIHYLVMERMGENLSELCKRQAFGKFSMQTVLKLGSIFLKIIEHVHRAGYLHRDIKPSNFVVGPNRRANLIYIIDFGLARRHILPTGQVRPEKERPGFRGTARYASINSHIARDLGRRDDLWSILYVLIEFSRGFLPWSNIKNRDDIRDTKIQLNTPELVSKLPPEFLEFMNHLQTLEFADRPNYEYFICAFERRLKRLEGGYPAVYDWIRVDNGVPDAFHKAYFLDKEGLRRNEEKKVSSRDKTYYELPNECTSTSIYKLVATGGIRQSYRAQSFEVEAAPSNDHVSQSNSTRLEDVFVLNSESVKGFVQERVKKGDYKVPQEVTSMTNATQYHVELSEYERRRYRETCGSCWARVSKVRRRLGRTASRVCRCSIL
ncbi:probable serine/threonine-protein kinase DDB_G0292354 [Schistocerca gregaria]|uniref:probable serine/threonine-protein kinase DDB_G0292354 n=1 Tax=Schistocerca gregaria TaxID=7010 RepID=UPI00211DE77D|nr:probable serine/threonine-protein kinase DDB_G0292354 [Schistocerca gregaria]